MLVLVVSFSSSPSGMVLRTPEPVATAALTISSFAGRAAVATATPAGAAAGVGLACFEEKKGKTGDEQKSQNVV